MMFRNCLYRVHLEWGAGMVKWSDLAAKWYLMIIDALRITYNRLINPKHVTTRLWQPRPGRINFMQFDNKCFGIQSDWMFWPEACWGCVGSTSRDGPSDRSVTHDGRKDPHKHHSIVETSHEWSRIWLTLVAMSTKPASPSTAARTLNDKCVFLNWFALCRGMSQLTNRITTFDASHKTFTLTHTWMPPLSINSFVRKAWTSN
jgi:hypothetical protein